MFPARGLTDTTSYYINIFAARNHLPLASRWFGRLCLKAMKREKGRCLSAYIHTEEGNID
jgi:hypothetical protein